MANPKPNIGALHAHGPSLVGYVEQEIDRYIHCLVKGVPYTPGPLPDKPVLIRKKEAMRRVGLSYPTMWLKEKKGIFPKRVHLSGAADAAAG
jgi:predicted DNA-binding transcriptional regulator AlpA